MTYIDRVVRPGTWRGAVLATAALIAALAMAPAASADGTATKRLTRSAADVREYWTTKRMAAALPGELLVLDEALSPRIGLAAPELSGSPLSVGAVGPSPRASEIGDPTAAPNRTHGKVFFTLGGIDYVCSGTAVTSFRKNLVASAGHCAYGEGEFATEWMFAPGYRNGETPFGEWVARRLATTPGWRKSEDLRYDVSIATVRKNSQGRKLQRVVGARGIAFGLGRDRTYDARGYPAGAPFDGERQISCISAYKGADKSFNAPKPMRIKCDQTGGASGGGWVIKGGRVNSVVSYGYECGIGPLPLPLPLPCDNDEDGNLFGPYFGTVAKKLYLAERGPRRRNRH